MHINFFCSAVQACASKFLLLRASGDNAGSVSATSSLLSEDSVQQKVAADGLPHVVCLKCDPNEVTGFTGKAPDRSEQPDRISKIHLQRAVTAPIENFNMPFFKVLTESCESRVFGESSVFDLITLLYLSACFSHSSGLQL